MKNTKSNDALMISYSDAEDFNSCTRKEYYGGRLNLKKIGGMAGVNRGAFMHAILEEFFLNGMDPAAGQAVLNQKIMDHGADVLELVGEVQMLYNFFLASKVYEGWEVLGVEEKFALDVTTDIEREKGQTLLYPFTIDLIIRDPFGQVLIVDHKTTFQFYYDRQIQLNSQLPKYMAALNVLHEQGLYPHKIDGCAYHEIRHRYPKGTSMDDHKAVIRFTEFTPTPARLIRSLEEQINAMQKIAFLRGLPIDVQERHSIRTANNMVCNLCFFSELCISDLNDWDTQLLIDSGYETRENRYEEITPTEIALPEITLPEIEMGIS